MCPAVSRFRALSRVLPAVLLTTTLVACGGGGDDPPAPVPEVPATGPGALISSTPVNTLSAQAITTAMSDPDSKVHEGLAPRYDVSSWRLVYQTTDKYGLPVQASGLVSVPVKAAGTTSPVLSYQHATVFRDNQAPSLKVEAVEPPIVLASLGYVVVSADYVGFGQSRGQDHPYLNATPTARAVVDMLSAAQTWRRQAGVADNGQLFLAGYSEGGYATLAAHRAIHQDGGTLKTQLMASVSGAGPYDLLATLDSQLDRVRNLAPWLSPLIDPANLSRLPGTVRDELRRLLVRQMVPDDADVSYQTLFLDRYLADQRALIALEHSVHTGWAPSVPVYLFHGRQDQTVPYAAATSALAALRAAGASSVSLTDCTTPDYGHLDCVPEYFRFTLDRLGRLARDL
ncbi:MAG: lipase family protein [Proteobacteria bacterium]|nr:lipase family protein [Pseudomonadota bacterium]